RPCGYPVRPTRDRPRSPPGPGPWRCAPWSRSTGWRSRRLGPPGGEVSAAAPPGGVVIGRHSRGPLSLGHGPIRRDRGLGQEAGGHLVGEAAEAIVDLDFDLSEAGGVLIQPVE